MPAVLGDRNVGVVLGEGGTALATAVLWEQMFFIFHRQRENPVLRLHTHIIDRLAVLNGLMSGVALYPQVLKVLTSGDFSGVSALSFVIIFMNNIVWALYAFHRSLVSLFIAAVLNVLASGVLLFALV
ncbi:MAG: hypothetical protein COT71_03540 [Candidatus Andersenbacteria bacterium CG10_big_fil_rev_8_21_14_0_10_54_11]|uniref:Uncharacterized protein n=1 Tax=Candidatus Andersenbacteria bacterium CG10_big_fil_rev_8_21_14_0_10_54_11 TaxID=1974485 RepID=A0A2M6WYN4_9BACT|nr:MAG: hypothetical protein COT71_03540 [Candidatus Andersenbacteria bacterium CG10_big_fil_rev_8_21_14_0_10_54_11]